MKNDEGVVRAYSGPLALVEIYQAALAENGIESRVVGTDLSAGLGSALPGTTELWVHENDLPRAAEILSREVQKDTPQAE